MPKIIIKEADFTTSGTLRDYANYAVLIAGFETKNETDNETDKKVKPDSNNVYEFNSVTDFIDTVGYASPDLSEYITNGSATYLKHYGNQMAYELLQMGYTVIYKSLGNITKDFRDAEDAESADKEKVLNAITSVDWSVFKDKANYDFRFITHGLLSSEPAELYVDQNKTYEDELKNVEEAKEALDDLKTEATKAYNEYLKSLPATTDGSTESGEGETPAELTLSYFINEAYDSLNKVKYDGLICDIIANEDGSTSTQYYESFDEAEDGLDTRSITLNSKLKTLGMGYLNADDLNDINKSIATLAADRGDCIALLELDEQNYFPSTVPAIEDGIIVDELKGPTETEESSINKSPELLIIDGIDKISLGSDAGKCCAMTVPSVVYNMTGKSEYNENKKFPGAFHYLACFVNSLNLGFKEWYAAAGYTRGVSNYKIDYTTVKLGEIAINALEPRSKTEGKPAFACNVIANFRGSYYLWGNRTAHQLGDENGQNNDLIASSFLNIRQLCITIKKQLYTACRRFTFDPNSDTLWFNFVNAIKPTLELMKADQGIRDYKILKVATKEKATLKAKIRIIPIEAVEDFEIEVFLEDSFGETIVQAND